MFEFTLTTEEQDRIVEFINGENPGFASSGIAEKLFRIAGEVQKRMVKELSQAQKRIEKQEEKVVRLEDRNRRKMEMEAEEGVFSDLDIDSVTFAKAVAAVASRYMKYVSRTRIICLMYECYAAWLVSHRQRLFNESPVRTKWGVNFWRVYKAISGGPFNGDEECFRKIVEMEPGAANLICNVTVKYAGWNDNVLQERFLKSRPVMEAENNKRIDDAKIYGWKKEAAV